MNELRVFQNTEFGELGVLEENGKVFFPATECARKLGYENPHKAINDHCRGVTKREGVSLTTNQHGVTSEQRVTKNYIPEGDLYRLIVSSRLPAAERFEKWVFDEVLPTIRRTGCYAPDMSALIVQAVQATVKELLPYMLGAEASDTVKLRRRRMPTAMDALEAGVRQEAEDMLLSGRYTYGEITAHLYRNYGMRISHSAFGRYAIKVRERAAFLDE